MSVDYKYKLDNFLFPLIKGVPNRKILELGVQNETSTHKFLELCNKNNNYHYSVEIDDCSKVSDDSRWNFMKTREISLNNIL